VPARHRSRLDILVTPQFLGASLDSQRISVLTVKYQTPDGTFFTYAVQDKPLTIELADQKFTPGADLQVIGAYYGNKNEYRTVLAKMKHYDYFRWNEIRVNHETFPSSPGVDDPEYLTLVYLNEKGIHVISCAENETLCYTSDRKGLYLKDTSTCILPGIITLEWEAGMDCTWAGAVYAALRYMGEPYTYEQIMGLSGACCRIAFTEIWDWSAADALVAFDCASILFTAIGYEPIWADRVDKDGRIEERRNIVRDISNGKPVVAINLRVAPEWGVITGFRENGKVFYCRTYFDREYLSDKDEYLESESWPFLIIHFGERKDRPSDSENLKASLQTLVDSFEAGCSSGYFQGRQAYEQWIAGLRNRRLWDKGNSKDDIERRLAVNDYLLLNLIDARRCAAAYLNENVPLLKGEKAGLLTEIAGSYSSIAGQLSSFRSQLKAGGEEPIRYYAIDTKISTRCLDEQADLLESMLQAEKEIADKAKRILA